MQRVSVAPTQTGHTEGPVGEEGSQPWSDHPPRVPTSVIPLGSGTEE